MPWSLDSHQPIFIQLVDKIKLDIVSGVYRPGDKLPSVRELAAEAAVNPNTMQKALSELERTGLVYTQRTSGRFITEDKTMIEQSKNLLAKEKITEFFDSMKSLGYRPEEILLLLADCLKDTEEAN